jgi:PTH1 family peptidyl-tRNA hydrolase
MTVVVGLGNPGSAHAQDRHNVGFMVLDQIAGRCGTTILREAHHARVGECTLSGEQVLLVKPQAFMNRSGWAVASVAEHYALGPEAFVAVYDDMDLPLGRVRVRGQGGPAGHRGVASIIDHLGSHEFRRVRVGIGRPPAGTDPAEFVLMPFGPAEHPLAFAALERAAEAVQVLIAEGMERAMNRFNGSDGAAPPGDPAGRLK